LKQIAWYGFQIAVFAGIVVTFTADDAPAIGLAPVLFLALGITAVATALVFWTGRLIALAARACFGEHRQAEYRGVDGPRISSGRESGKFSTSPRLGKEPR
jgi:hypothetical protein